MPEVGISSFGTWSGSSRSTSRVMTGAFGMGTVPRSEGQR